MNKYSINLELYLKIKKSTIETSFHYVALKVQLHTKTTPLNYKNTNGKKRIENKITVFND